MIFPQEQMAKLTNGMPKCMFLLFFVVALVGAQGECPPGYENHPLVVVSMDGFRAEYLERGLTPNIQAMKDRGTSAPSMRASYPTVTFTNHYTIVTGLYPESHGIIANEFYDPDFDAEFGIGTDESVEGRWWGGEPIWNTVVKQGKLSGTVYWTGSDADIEGMYPTYYYTYSGDLLPYPGRIDQILDWLALPESLRPIWMCVYFDEPDHAGHYYGPNSDQVNSKLEEVDALIGKLVDGIAHLNLTDCVNVILVSDHGMTAAGKAKTLELTDFVPHLDKMGVTYQGSFVRIDLYEEYEDQTNDIRKNLTCQRPEIRQYIPSGLPKRFHFSNNVRIEDIVLDLNLGYEGKVLSHYYLEGNHGYDNYYADMEPIFISDGPEFRNEVEVESFQNIELYNLMCHLVGVIPAPNNGTEGSLYHLLSSPPAYPSLPTETPPPPPPYPSENEIFNRQHISGCRGDDNSPLNLNFSSEVEVAILETHLPWGTPLSGDLPANLILLYQEDHVTGYSQTLKMPSWTSFTIDTDFVKPPPSKWSSDIRLTSENTPTCQDYEHLSSMNITMQPLFPNRYGSDSSSGAVDFMVSNAVPMTREFVPRWQYLVKNFLHDWIVNWSGPVNVVAGPLFDNNADSHVDDFTTFNSTPTLPSDLFLIITRCVNNGGSSLNNCPTDNLDTLAFIYPETIDIPNCLNMEEFALEFSAKVRDIEIASGFTFFPKLPYKDRTRLAIRVHTSLWPLHSN